MLVVRQFRFEAAHRLPNYPGPCRNLHGHSYKLEVGVEGEPDEKTGMVVDFARLKNIVQREVIIHLDHAYLNDLSVPIGQSSFPYNQPTAENIVAWIYNRLEHYWATNNERGEIAFLRLWETSDSYVEERLR